jgi:hypothetical protein
MSHHLLLFGAVLHGIDVACSARNPRIFQISVCPVWLSTDNQAEKSKTGGDARHIKAPVFYIAKVSKACPG